MSRYSDTKSEGKRGEEEEGKGKGKKEEKGLKGMM
jgi:hypothetical protein